MFAKTLRHLFADKLAPIGDIMKSLAWIVCLGAGCLLSVGCSDSTGLGSLAKPAVPVVVSHRESMIGNGKVAIFCNQTSNRLTITVECRNQQHNQTEKGSLDLDPNGMKEIGWMEGWPFHSGDTITMSHPNYCSKTVTIP